MDNSLEIVKVLNLLRIAYPHIERDKTPDQIEQMFDLYVEMLIDIDVLLLKVAAKQYIAEGKFFPTVADLRNGVLALKTAAANEPDAEQAWDELMRQISRHGYSYWSETTWSTDAVRETAKLFWHDACKTDIESLPTVRAQFRNAYNARTQRAQQHARELPATTSAIGQLAAALDASTPRRLMGAKDGSR